MVGLKAREAQRQGSRSVGTGVPVLWHLKVSNFNEKARWALDYKGIPHVRRALVPGRHPTAARKLSGGRTLPVLVIDGRAIGDSTDIVAALERRWPDPPLYPEDPVQRRQALELEELFDEELGPASRLLFLAHTVPDARLMLGAFVPDLAGVRRVAARATFPLIRRRVIRQFGISQDSVAAAYDTLGRIGAHIRSGLAGGDYLVGNAFSVADLTAAALLAPPVAPTQFPYPQPQRNHPRLAPVREALRDTGVLEWILEMYARHRGRSAEIRV
jgi:glutathione S-transferase